MAKHDAKALPSDLPTLRDLLIERLEATALGAIKSIERAVGQQGVIAAAACDDEANARDGQATRWTGKAPTGKEVIEARNLSGTVKEGALAICPGWTVADVDGDDPGVTVTRGPASRLTLTVPRTAGLSLTITAKAQNLCSDSTCVVTVDA